MRLRTLVVTVLFCAGCEGAVIFPETFPPGQAVVVRGVNRVGGGTSIDDRNRPEMFIVASDGETIAKLDSESKQVFLLNASIGELGLAPGRADFAPGQRTLSVEEIDQFWFQRPGRGWEKGDSPPTLNIPRFNPATCPCLFTENQTIACAAECEGPTGIVAVDPPEPVAPPLAVDLVQGGCWQGWSAVQTSTDLPTVHEYCQPPPAAERDSFPCPQNQAADFSGQCVDVAPCGGGIFADDVPGTAIRVCAPDAPGGCIEDAADLAAAAAAALPGTVIALSAGTHSVAGAVAFADRVSLRGVCPARTRVDGATLEVSARLVVRGLTLGGAARLIDVQPAASLDLREAELVPEPTVTTTIAMLVRPESEVLVANTYWNGAAVRDSGSSICAFAFEVLRGANATFQSSTFEGFVARVGLAHSAGASVTLEDSIVRRNGHGPGLCPNDAHAGGIAADFGASVSVRNSLFENNQNQSLTVAFAGSSMDVQDSVIVIEEADPSRVGIVNGSADLSVARTAILGQDGPAISSFGVDPPEEDLPRVPQATRLESVVASGTSGGRWLIENADGAMSAERLLVMRGTAILVDDSAVVLMDVHVIEPSDAKSDFGVCLGAEGCPGIRNEIPFVRSSELSRVRLDVSSEGLALAIGGAPESAGTAILRDVAVIGPVGNTGKIQDVVSIRGINADIERILISSGETCLQLKGSPFLPPEPIHMQGSDISLQNCGDLALTSSAVEQVRITRAAVRDALCGLEVRHGTDLNASHVSFDQIQGTVVEMRDSSTAVVDHVQLTDSQFVSSRPDFSGGGIVELSHLSSTRSSGEHILFGAGEATISDFVLQGGTIGVAKTTGELGLTLRHGLFQRMSVGVSHQDRPPSLLDLSFEDVPLIICDRDVLPNCQSN